MKRKITGFMIWNFDHAELIEAIFNDKKLEEIFEKSKKTVQNTMKWKIIINKSSKTNKLGFLNVKI